MQLKLSSTLDEHKYKEYIQNDRNAVSKLKDIQEIHNKWFREHYIYGLCSYGYQSDSLKLICPFDIRTKPESYEETNMFKIYDELAKHSRCRNFCKISSILYQMKIEEPGVIENIGKRKILLLKIKRILNDFLSKV